MCVHLLFLDMGHDQMNRSPTAEYQNSTYRICLKIAETKIIRKPLKTNFADKEFVIQQLTPPLSASGAVHLMGNFPTSRL